ncbi:hypothetical protein, partial [Deinococcus pimensis]|uniref:hypothetical protein n=1 Tax=Deinococcus pimensis TaxID=309888 RepID=UPI0005EB0E46
MNDRILDALRSAGFDVRPTATLDKEGAFFALSDDILIYAEGGRASHVQLRDITRIHSDNQGVLRVDTPAGNAVTASLLGYDVARVQHFFGEVKNATARAKSQPAPHSGSPWKTGFSVAGGSSAGAVRPP